MKSTQQKPALVGAKSTPKAKTIVYWIVTALFCLQMSFTAYAQLRLPQVAGVHPPRLPRLLPGLSWAKLLGVVLMLAPVPAYSGVLVLLLAPPAVRNVTPMAKAKATGHAGERLTAHRRRA
jgi:hypothetical protein